MIQTSRTSWDTMANANKSVAELNRESRQHDYLSLNEAQVKVMKRNTQVKCYIRPLDISPEPTSIKMHREQPHGMTESHQIMKSQLPKRPHSPPSRRIDRFGISSNSESEEELRVHNGKSTLQTRSPTIHSHRNQTTRISHDSTSLKSTGKLTDGIDKRTDTRNYRLSETNYNSPTKPRKISITPGSKIIQKSSGTKLTFLGYADHNLYTCMDEDGGFVLWIAQNDCAPV